MKKVGDMYQFANTQKYFSISEIANLFSAQDNAGDIWFWKTEEEFRNDNDNRNVVLKVSADEWGVLQKDSGDTLFVDDFL